MTRPSISRRAFLHFSAISGGAMALGSRLALATPTPAAGLANRGAETASTRVTVSDGSLAVKLQWAYASGAAPSRVRLTLSARHDLHQPIVRVDLPGGVTTYPVVVVPGTRYYWQLQIQEGTESPLAGAAEGTFTTRAITMDDTSDDVPGHNALLRYGTARPYGWNGTPSVPVGNEPLSPWYDVKRNAMAPPPKLAEVKDRFPQPVLERHADALETYWYCWKTLLEMWYSAPWDNKQQAVANVNGDPVWTEQGSSQIWDSSWMMFYAKYGHQAYPFITQFDNAYARQHENGFICKETNMSNEEQDGGGYIVVYSFLMGWAEWNYYQISGDVERLRRVFTPIVKNYEWWMIFMRRKLDGAYCLKATFAPGEGDWGGDTSFNYASEDTAMRAPEALALSRIAALIGRPDMAAFFADEHRRIGALVNQHFWDDRHQVYADRYDLQHPVARYRDPSRAGQFITDEEGTGTYAPLFGEIVPPDRLALLLHRMQRQIHPDGVDSDIWPPSQVVVQEGFKAYGHREMAREVAERYWAAEVAAYTKEKTIYEHLDGDVPKGLGHREFVGWGGVAPIANLIEYVLGFEINAPAKTIEWHIGRTERHGLTNLRLGPASVDLLCETRATAASPCTLTITSSGPFTLYTVFKEQRMQHRIAAGTVTLHLG